MRTSVGAVTLDVPSETWEGDGATMSCTFPIRNNFWEVQWSKGANVVYVYDSESTETKIDDRYKGRLEGNVNKLTISSTTVGDEDTYTCDFDGRRDSKMLTVNGYYSKP